MIWPNRRPTELTARFQHVWVHPTAEIAPDVSIGPFSVIGADCKIAAGCILHNNVTLVQNVEMGRDNEMFPGVILGGLPQDKKYRGEESFLTIGDRNTIRENVTINSGTALGDGLTVLGDDNLIMGGCHIAHDCILDDRITMANNVLLGGHVRVERFASFGGLAAVHHFVTVGHYAFVGGMTRISQDVPPYMLLEGNPSRVRSINRVGLKRRGFSTEVVNALKIAHRLLYRSGNQRAETIEDLLRTYPEIEEVQILSRFLRATELSNQGRARQPLSYDADYVTTPFRSLSDESDPDSPDEGEELEEQR